jgi:hypothetical protein
MAQSANGASECGRTKYDMGHDLRHVDLFDCLLWSKFSTR